MKKFIFILFICMFSLGNGCSKTQTKPMTDEQTSNLTTIQGKISIKGNEPHTWLALTTKEGRDYRLKGDLAKTLRNHYQQQVVVLEGEILSKSKTPGLPSAFAVHNMVTQSSTE